MVYILFLLVLIPVSVSAQSDNDFISAWISDSPDIENYIDEEELRSSNRMGITYYNVKHKLLMNTWLAQLQPGERGLTFEKSNEGIYDVYTFKSSSRSLHFKNGKYISPVTYHTRNFQQAESRYFRFKTSDNSLYNPYSIRRLDNFVDTMLSLMDFSSADKELLGREKILYILCKNESEIEQVTGVKSRGQYFVAKDAVVSTYNTHFHEVAHFLINFKLRENIKPALIFFLEGFAVAMGGRGGINAKVMNNIGSYLINSGFMSYNEMLSPEQFASTDASIGYAVAGLYNHFLISNYGFDNYLETYSKYSGEPGHLNMLSSSNIALPADSEFKTYLQNTSFSKISIDNSEEPAGENIFILKNGKYHFSTAKSLLFSEPEPPFKGYRSKQFEESFPGETYNGEKYLLQITDNGVSIYNLYTNELIDSYSTGFSLTAGSFSMKNGKYNYSVEASLFDEDLNNMKITQK